MVKVAVELPAATVTRLGTVADPLDEDRLTRAPPGPAWPLSVTVPVELLPPTTEVGETVTLTKVAAVRVSVPCCEPPRVPVTFTVVVELTPPVVTVKLAEVCPAGIVTEAGTVASDVSELLRLTVMPPAGAGPLIVAVPVELLPPSTELGEKVMLVTVGA
jgi:hypothetical protein